MSVLGTQEMDDGVWGFTSGSITGNIWVRQNSKKETFVSKTANFMPFQNAVTFTPVTGVNFSSKAAFLAWACTQLGGGTLYEYDLTITWSNTTFPCGASSNAVKAPRKKKG